MKSKVVKTWYYSLNEKKWLCTVKNWSGCKFEWREILREPFWSFCTEKILELTRTTEGWQWDGEVLKHDNGLSFAWQPPKLVDIFGPDVYGYVSIRHKDFVRGDRFLSKSEMLTLAEELEALKERVVLRNTAINKSVCEEILLKKGDE